MFEIKITNQAGKDIRKLSSQTRDRFAKALGILAENPLIGEPLRGELKGLRRYRTGDFRIIYSIDKAQKTLIITAMRHRREAYR
ncbi:MAG: type II toxin-antitoxin system RelE/ParE family toxin [bacterium]